MDGINWGYVAYWVGIVVIFVAGIWLGKGGGKWQLGEIRDIVAMLVHEAEQTMPGDTGEEKLAWVLAQCDRVGITKWIPAPVLSAMIESTVFRLKQTPTAPAKPASSPAMDRDWRRN